MMMMVMIMMLKKRRLVDEEKWDINNQKLQKDPCRSTYLKTCDQFIRISLYL